VTVDVPPCATEVGLAANVTVGAGVEGAAATVTVTDLVLCPPAPEHVSLNVPEEVRFAIVRFPARFFAPDHAPEAAHEVVSSLVHVSNVDWP